jgi:hypothetical protein
MERPETAPAEPPREAAPRVGLPMCVHVGLTKTATTLLQRHLFPRHPQVEYLGKFLETESGFPGRYHRDKVVKRVITELLDDGALAPDLERCRWLVRKAMQATAPGRRIMVWSAEELCKGPEALHAARARNLAAVFGSCHVLVVLRHPVSHVVSEHFQSIRRISVRPAWEKRKREAPVDLATRIAWFFAEGERGDLTKLHYARTIAAYREALGRDSVGVFVFEELQEDPRRFLTRMSDFLAIDPAQTWSLCDGRRENERWSVNQIERLQSITTSWWHRWVFRFATRRRRMQMLGLDPATGEPEHAGPRADAEVPPEWRRRIEDLTRDGNRWLAREWNLPLEKYGYPL